MNLQFVCALLAISVALVRCQTSDESNERYIVLLYKGSTDAQLEKIIHEVEIYESLSRQELHIESHNHILPMLIGNISKAAAEMVSGMDTVHMVEKDQIFTASSIPPPQKNCKNFVDFEYTNRYNLDIIDEIGSLDGTYEPFNYGKGADIYILDTGINYDHEDFRWRNGKSGTRAKYPGFDPIDYLYGENREGRDCHGHGTHCAGVAAGLCSGIAKDANIFSLRVLDCRGYGSITSVCYGINRAYSYHSIRNQSSYFVASIVSMSLGGGSSDILNMITNEVVEKGVIIVTASGNGAADACNSSPGGAGLNINVGAHGYDENTNRKPMAYFSNYGPCVDIMAPGLNVVSASHSFNSGYVVLSGTSMSCPHVAGLSALIKAEDKYLTPEEVKNRIKDTAIDDIDRSHMRLIVRLVSDAKRAYIY